jgi:hypothetical protein
VLAGHTNRVTTLAALANSRFVSGIDDRTVHVWSLRLDLDHIFVADAPINCLTVTPAGVVGAGCEDGAVQFLPCLSVV